MANSDNSTSPSFLGGLMAAFQGSQSAPGLQNAGTSPLMNLGLGLMSAAAPHLYLPGNVGDALMGANQATLQNRQAQQNLSMNALQLQKAQAMWPAYQATLEAVARRLNGGQ